MGAARRNARGNSMGKGIQRKVRFSTTKLCLTWRLASCNSVRLFLSKRLLGGGGKQGKLKVREREERR